MPVCTSRRRSSLQDVQNRTNASWFLLTESAFKKYQWCWKNTLYGNCQSFLGIVLYSFILFPKTYTPICLYPLYIQMPIASLFSFHVLATYIFIGGKTNVWWYPPFYAKQTNTYNHEYEPGNSAFLGWLSDPLKGCKCDLPPIGISYRGRGLSHLELVQGYLPHLISCKVCVGNPSPNLYPRSRSLLK